MAAAYVVQDVQHSRFRAHRKELEDSEHAARRDVIAVDEAKCVCDRVPEPLNGPAGTARPFEPLGERDVIKLAHTVHAAIKVNEGLHGIGRMVGTCGAM